MFKMLTKKLTKEEQNAEAFPFLAGIYQDKIYHNFNETV